MTDLFSRFKRLIPEIEGELAVKFGSGNPDHRAAIRARIESQLPSLSPEEKKRLADLKWTPRLTHWSVSISHGRTLGGWVARRRPGSIGFDVEVKERIEPRLISRIATPEEIALAPEPAFLWCAKESYFKCLEADQPVTMSSLKISNWHRGEDGAWHFSGDGHRGEGVLIENSEVIAATCVSI